MLAQDCDIKAIIGLGNPGRQYYKTRHNIGFLILDELAQAHAAQWQDKENMLIASIQQDGRKILLVKPQTFMNSSGRVVPYLQKQGIKIENILVVHDELELSFGKIKVKCDGGARGHNGLRSIIESAGKNFWRLAFGIGRPVNREDVPDYVLSNFSENDNELHLHIYEALSQINQLIKI